MDITKPKSPKPRLKQAVMTFVALLCVGVTGRALWQLGSTDYTADSGDMVFAKVKQGDFTVTVMGSGLLVADHIQWLTSNVPAQVEEIAAKPGKTVVTGEILVRLSNPQLHQTLKESQWELEAMEAESRAQKVNEESLLLDQETLALDAELNYESTKLRLTAQQTLMNNNEGSTEATFFKQGNNYFLVRL